jgi:hypothetical protein
MLRANKGLPLAERGLAVEHQIVLCVLDLVGVDIQHVAHL